MIIETFREYFSISIYGQKHPTTFLQCFGFAQIVNFVWLTDTIFQKLHTRQWEILPVFPPKFPFEPAEMSVQKYQAFFGLTE